MSEAVQGPGSVRSERRILFVDRPAGNDLVLMAFKDPSPQVAVLTGSASTARVREVDGDEHADALDVVLIPVSAASPGAEQDSAEWLEKMSEPGAPPPIMAKYRGVELMWRPGRAMLRCESERTEVLLAALIEFAHFEHELRRIEGELAGAWEELEQDKALAFEVTTADLKRSKTVGERMNRALERRIRLARIGPYLYEPDPKLQAAGQKLGEELREKARIEARLEAVDGQLEVFEDIYEISSQRMGEYRAAHQESILEWVIILLLAAELILLLMQAVWHFGV